MPKNAAELAEPTGQKPTVSVSEAMGLPEDWSLSGALKGTAAKSGTEDADADDDALPDGAEEEEDGEKKPEEKKTGEKSEGAEEEEAGEEKPAPKKEAKKEAKAEPEKKGAKKEEKKVDKAKAKPADKTEEKAGEKSDAKKAEEKPAPKIKVGDKEYTQAELEAAIKKPEAKQPVAEKADEKVLTKEQIAERETETKKKENDWIAATAKVLDAPIDEPLLDKILTGGPEGVAAFQEVRRQDMARAILITRKSMFESLQPIIDDLRARQEPFINSAAQAADEKEWGIFSTEYPKFAGRREAVESVAMAMVDKEGERVVKLSLPEFRAEVAQRTEKLLKTFGVNLDEAPAETGGKKAAAAETEETSEEKTEEKPGEKAAAKKEERVKMKPPGANAPSPAVGKGAKGKGGDSEIISSLW